MSPLGVSVVTTTWNEQENIEALIAAAKLALQGTLHEIIVVDDESTDGTFEIAKRTADVAATKKREGQSKGLLYGINLAKHPSVVTIDADLENNPEHIPTLVKLNEKFDIVVASRRVLPRISEKIASETLGRLLGVKDVFSNFKAIRKGAIQGFVLRGGETFGAELLVLAKKKKMSITQFEYTPPLRREKPRIGGTVKANLRIFWATIKLFFLYML